MSKLLSTLPVGALVKDTGTIYNGENPVFRVLEHGHTGDPTGSTTLDFRDVIAFKCFDGMEPQNTNSDRQQYGNNRYIYSNLLQWLNSEEYANEWYTPQHSTDTPPSSDYVYEISGLKINPYDIEDGFLTNFSPSLKHALLTVTKTVAKNTVTDGGGSETVSSKLFLLSCTETGLTNNNTPVEGTLYSYYNSSSETICDKYAMNELAFGNDPWEDITISQKWWLRSPNVSYAYLIYIHHGQSEGKVVSNYGAATGRCGVSPAFCIPSNTYVSDNPDEKGVYTIMWDGTYDHDDRIVNVGNLRTFKAGIEEVVDDKIVDSAYSEGNGIDIANKIISVTIDNSNARGLSAGSNGLALAAATPDTYSGSTKTADGTAGAMSSADKYKLDNIGSISTSYIDSLFT